jgi:hypothetical protein
MVDFCRFRAGVVGVKLGEDRDMMQVSSKLTENKMETQTTKQIGSLAYNHCFWVLNFETDKPKYGV